MGRRENMREDGKMTTGPLFDFIESLNLDALDEHAPSEPSRTSTFDDWRKFWDGSSEVVTVPESSGLPFRPETPLLDPSWRDYTDADVNRIYAKMDRGDPLNDEEWAILYDWAHRDG
jgi:hypothetical protein